jgi:putative ATPase
MQGLFDTNEPIPRRAIAAPLAERMRPQALGDVVGQDHLLGERGALRGFLSGGLLPSLVLWGPPGTGKTTLARLLAQSTGARLHPLSAVDSGVKELREVLARARHDSSGKRPVMFIDEIHRFSKSQQDALLHAVEQGTITLIGATTENPSFEVNAALLSRCRVYRLRELDDASIRNLVERALETDAEMAQAVIDDWAALLRLAAGDARKALNAVEAAAASAIPEEGTKRITAELLERVLQQRVVRYDKRGEQHYDVVSAFIKSMRGSDPDAALLWLAVMIDAGEDPRFIARRMVVFASEDIGNADALALTVAMNAFLAVERIGMPEGRIILAQATTYLASAPKSNASYVAIDAALDYVRQGGALSVPLHLRNAPFRLMKENGYGGEYEYPHSYDGHVVQQNYFADGMPETLWYRPDEMEEEIRNRLQKLWPNRWKDES